MLSQFDTLPVFDNDARTHHFTFQDKEAGHTTRSAGVPREGAWKQSVVTDVRIHLRIMSQILRQKVNSQTSQLRWISSRWSAGGAKHVQKTWMKLRLPDSSEKNERRQAENRFLKTRTRSSGSSGWTGLDTCTSFQRRTPEPDRVGSTLPSSKSAPLARLYGHAHDDNAEPQCPLLEARKRVAFDNRLPVAWPLDDGVRLKPAGWFRICKECVSLVETRSVFVAFLSKMLEIQVLVYQYNKQNKLSKKGNKILLVQ